MGSILLAPNILLAMDMATPVDMGTGVDMGTAVDMGITEEGFLSGCLSGGGRVRGGVLHTIPLILLHQ